MVAFYELQLIILIGFCISALLLERYISRLSRAGNASTSDGGLGLGKSNASQVAKLTRQYLIVYAIVMCKNAYLIDLSFRLMDRNRRRLVTRSIRILAVQRSVCFRGTHSRYTFRDRIHIRRSSSTVCGCMG